MLRNLNPCVRILEEAVGMRQRFLFLPQCILGATFAHRNVQHLHLGRAMERQARYRSNLALPELHGLQHQRVAQMLIETRAHVQCFFLQTNTL